MARGKRAYSHVGTAAPGPMTPEVEILREVQGRGAKPEECLWSASCDDKCGDDRRPQRQVQAEISPVLWLDMAINLSRDKKSCLAVLENQSKRISMWKTNCGITSHHRIAVIELVHIKTQPICLQIYRFFFPFLSARDHTTRRCDPLEVGTLFSARKNQYAM